MGTRQVDDSTNNDFGGRAQFVVQARDVGSITYTEPELPKVSPRLVPAPVEWFTNRRDELDLLWDVVRRATEPRLRPSVVGLHGVPGIGKTELTRRVAAMVKDDFPDGALYASFAADASPSDAAERFLTALGVPVARVPAGLQPRADLLRSLTAERRLVLVFDDVTDAAQVTSLLPNSPSSLVLAVAVRAEALTELHLDGAVDLPLGPLSTAHAIEMLGAMCQDDRVAADPAAADELVKICGHLPMALRAAAGWLRTNRRWSVRRLADHLDRTDRSPVDAVFDLVYSSLDDDARRLYRLLGVIVGVHFGPEVLAAMADRPLDDVRDALDELGRAGLIEDRGDGVFGLHRRLRVHALSLAAEHDSAGDRRAALRRAAEWWLVGASVADVAATDALRLRIVPPDNGIVALAGSVSKPAALAWLNRELTNLLAVMTAAADQKWHDLVCRLFEALWPLLDARHPLAIWVQAGSLAVTSAEVSGNAPAEVRSRCLLAKAYQELGRFSDAHAELDRARALAASCGDRLVASTADFTGNVLLRESRFDEALASFRVALRINEQLGLPRAIALQSMLVGRALTGLGRYDEALAAFDRSRSILADGPARSLLPKLFVSTAKTLSAMGDLAAAERELLAAVDTAGATVPGAEALAELSTLAARRGDADAELGYRRQAVALYDSMGVSPRTAAFLAGLPEG